MNKAMYLIGLVVLILIVAMANVRAADTAPYSGAITALSATMAAADAALAAADVAQADTNVTTTATAYTPRRAGDVLVGGAGSGTNAVWIAKGTSTNDWVQIKP
jgi:uncharacterized MnhB-related membrane protein